MRTRTALLLLLLGTCPAAASECDNAITQADMNDCAKLSLRQADGELNDAYGELKARYKKYPPADKSLLAAQRAWITFRDAECALEALPNKGSTAKIMIRTQCLDRLTRDRVSALRIRLSCQEGDLTCIADGDAAD